MMIAIMLTYIVSFGLQFPPRVTIHNQYPNIELVSPVYFGNALVYPKLSDRQIRIGARMKTYFEINVTQNNFEGALLYELQKYPDNQCNLDASTTKISKNEAVHVHMLVAWKVKDSKPSIYVALVKRTKAFAWDEDKLKKLYDKNLDRLKEGRNTISNTWLMDDNETLKTTSSVNGFNEYFELSISISECEKEKEEQDWMGFERDNRAMKPLCIDLER
jgi:hypothetical protein